MSFVVISTVNFGVLAAAKVAPSTSTLNASAVTLPLPISVPSSKTRTTSPVFAPDTLPEINTFSAASFSFKTSSLAIFVNEICGAANESNA
ncbi:hypothetical protein BWP33_05700 [Simonsiella muelleri ATCC 29453]|nr:hypothetical protein [Simonsiella muelleri]AUX61351.1 hypothetical protein BWP33_05700 [Simonsiella muelleri ATCC 29453]